MTKRVGNRKPTSPSPCEARLHPLAATIASLLAGGVALGSAGIPSLSLAAQPLPLPKPAAAWTRVQTPVAGAPQFTLGSTSATYDGRNLDIRQRDKRVVLPWESFDIDTGHKVEFFQPDSASIALNRINEQVNPSHILGALKANGQVYLINKNGFVFGADSVVDVNSLVVSTLDIRDEVLQRGITKVFGQDGSPALEGNGEIFLRDPVTNGYLTDANGERLMIRIQVDEGAQIMTESGGRVLMAAPSIVNQGTISTPEGQVIMAAATDKVYLQEAGAGDGVRGLLVEVKTGGDVSNLGRILTERGNTTLMGFAVNQQGLISASTSVRVNGSIRLLAREGAPDVPRTDTNGYILEPGSTTRGVDNGDGLGTRARVTLGEQSITEVTPELEDTATAVDEQAQDKSRIEMMAHTLHLKSNSRVIVPSGEVVINATRNPRNPAQANTAQNDSRILMEAGSRIDVSGVDSVVRTMESNLVDVKLQSNELRDAPLQKNSFLKGETVRIDIRKGTALADVSGVIAGVERTVGERSTTGGTVTLASEGDAIIEGGATIDISGGAISYESGYIDTTQLVRADGRVEDIGDANPDVRYTRILGQVSKDYKKWGVTETWDVSGPVGYARFEAGYTEGQAAGTTSIKAHTLVLDGDVVANTRDGIHQRDADARAAGGRLEIDLARAAASEQSVTFLDNKAAHSIALSRLFPVDERDSFEADPTLSEEQKQVLRQEADSLRKQLEIEDDYLSRNHIRHTSITTNGIVEVQQTARVEVPEGGSLQLDGGQVTVDGVVEGHGADLAFATHLTSETAGRLSGALRFGAGSRVDASGHWINDSEPLNTGTPVTATIIDGGSIQAVAQGDVLVAAGSLLNVDGGAWLAADGGFTAGKGGDILLEAAGSSQTEGSSLVLEGTLSGDSFGAGGTLSLTSNAIRFVTEDTVSSPSGTGGTVPLLLPESFVLNNGFEQYRFSSNQNGILLDSGVLLTPQKRIRVLSDAAARTASYSALDQVSGFTRLPVTGRAPVDLHFVHHSQLPSEQDNAAITLSAGARIAADPQASITFESDTSVYLNGQVSTAGGRISARVIPPTGDETGFLKDQGIWLGRGSMLSVAGTFLSTPDPLGRQQGRLVDGGQITLQADRGYVVAEAGTLLDVSGVRTRRDIPDPAFTGLGIHYRQQDIASNAGGIELRAAEGIFMDSRLDGHADRALGARAGSLQVELNPAKRDIPTDGVAPGQLAFPETPRVIHVSGTPQDSVLPAAMPFGGEVPDADNGQAYLDAHSLAAGDFDSLQLTTPGEIRFHGDVTLATGRDIQLDAPKLGWQRETAQDAAVTRITSDYVALGSSQQRLADTASGGDGQLLVNANLIELAGATSLQDYSSAILLSNTDIRLRGRRIGSSDRDFIGQWQSSGDLFLLADRVYPATLSDYRIQADGVTLGHSDAQQARALVGAQLGGGYADQLVLNTLDAGAPLLSAAGTVRIEADNIHQGGSLLAPFGTLALTAADQLAFTSGSLTSTSAAGQVIPFGVTQAGLDWLYPLGTANLVFDAPPAQRIQLDADRIAQARDAVIDMSGGGDLQAAEFVSGPGGSDDFLKQPGVFAVLPGIQRYAPYDPGVFPASGLQVGDSIYLSGDAGLPAGQYALLPARYALLEGAYLVMPDSSGAGVTPGNFWQREDGIPVVAGYYSVAGQDVADPQWSGFAVTSGEYAHQRAQYDLSQAGEFFAARAQENEIATPLLPNDAGHLSIAARTRLSLEGELRAEAVAGGRGGRLDIQAEQLAVVAQRTGTAAPDFGQRVELLAMDLNRLQVESLLLGGVREETEQGIRIVTAARNILVEPNGDAEAVELLAPDIILAATDHIEVAAGATLTGSGKAGPQPEALLVNGDGALLRVSAGEQVAIERSPGNPGVKGDINIAAGASLSGDRSITLDATHATVIDGELAMQQGSLQLGAEQINFGAVPVGTTGLALDDAMLAQLGAQELVLTSRGNINFFGKVDFDRQQLVFNAAQLAGHGADDEQASVSAQQITLTHRGTGGGYAATGTGELQLAAQDILLDEGDYAITGFRQVTLQGTQTIRGRGASQVRVDGDLVLQAGRVTAESGSDTRIDASGHDLAILAGSEGDGTAVDSLGARLQLQADAIRHAGYIQLPAGTLDMIAKLTNVQLASGSHIDVSGRAIDFGDVLRVASAGSVQLKAEQGAVEIADDARINLNGAQRGGDAGHLQVSSTEQAFTYGGDITAASASGYAGGTLDLDVLRLEGGLDGLLDVQRRQAEQDDLNGVNRELGSRSFSAGVAVRVREGDLTLGSMEVLKAGDVALTADRGAVQIMGVIDAAGDVGGRVQIAAGDDVQVNGSIDASAHAAGEAGGQVLLSTLDSDGDGIGRIDVQGSVKVSAGDQGAGGEVRYRAQRSDSDHNGQDDEVAIASLGTVTGADQVVVEAVRGYEDVAVIDAARIEQWRTDTTNFMAAAAPAVASRLGSDVQLQAGIEVRNAGDITLSSQWDLASRDSNGDYLWRYGANDDTPGTLTIRAGGHLNLDASLSDAYGYGEIDLMDIIGLNVPVQDMLQPGHSWSYRLVSGADLASADVMATRAGQGDMTIASGVKVRTGTGDIDIASGGDFLLASDTAVLYTAGRPTDTGRWGSFKDGYTAFNFYAEYPVEGGDIRIRTDGDLYGAVTDQFMRDWLVSTGNWSRNASHAGETPTAWGIAVSKSEYGTVSKDPAFRQNIGALGGGDVVIESAGDIHDLSVVVPTSGKQVGTPKSLNDEFDFDFLTNEVEISGGGSLHVQAQGDIYGGLFYLGKGAARLQAGGSLLAGNHAGLSPVLALGDARFDLQANGDISLSAVIDPLVVQPSIAPDLTSYLFSYSADSAVALTSYAGDVVLRNNTGDLQTAVNINFNNTSAAALNLYPGGLDIAALDGRIELQGSMVLYPSATGSLNLLARDGISAGDTGNLVNFTMSDADPTLLPTVLNPSLNFLDAKIRLDHFAPANAGHAVTPLHAGDAEANHIIALEGDIGGGDDLLITLPKRTQVRAGHDLRDVSLRIQNLEEEDDSSIVAGRDIRFTSPRDENGNVKTLEKLIQVSGPGNLQVRAGRNLDLGSSTGIESIGDTFNPALADRGANLLVMAGLADEPDYAAFATRYLSASDVTADEAAAFAALSEQDRQRFLLKRFLAEIQAAGVAAAGEGPAAYADAYEAIDALFPTARQHPGDIKLFFSKIHTIDGGDLDLFAPGGIVNAGLASSEGLDKSPDKIGIVAQREGAISAYALGDFLVNQSRVFALGGDDILIFSREGNIDAGRGAKSALAAPPPIVSFDEQGNLQIEFPAVVRGSGIRTASSDAAVEAGDVYLFAPSGVVDAGEAGIGANNIVIAAQEVIGADNIDIGGVSTGVPVGDTSSLAAGLSGVSNLSSSTSKIAEDSAGSIGANSAQDSALSNTPMGFLSVELLGFGDASGGSDRNENRNDDQDQG